MSGEKLLITNIRRLVTMERAEGRSGKLGVITDAAVVVDGGYIEWIGPAKDLPSFSEDIERFDAMDCVVLPGLIDCHTHVVHGGYRQLEFVQKAAGVSYEEIARRGGGIISTVCSTREASFDKLYQSVQDRVDEAMAKGTVTMEVKTGYGLNVETELKMLDVIRTLKDNHPIRFVPTFLGAHALPLEYVNRRDYYIDYLIGDMLPRVAEENLCLFCDVFVEEIAFSIPEARRIIEAARAYGMKPKLHVDQLSPGGGAELAAEVGAVSADHLEFVSDAGCKALAESGVVAVLLPGAAYFMGGKRYAPARKLLDSGVVVAVATDYNPGTNPCLTLFLAANMAVTQMHMTVDEALEAITKNAAKALGLDSDSGSIAVGKRADMILLDCEDEYMPLYRYDHNFVKGVIKKGRHQWVGEYFLPL